MAVPSETRQPDRPRAAGHEVVDHTSEITLRLYGPSFSSLVSEATRAFAELAGPAQEASGDRWRDFRVGGEDRAAQLVEWINELVYLSEAEEWLGVEAEVVAEHGPELHIRARGVDLPAPFVFVKAATLHNATVREGPLGFEMEVTLDV